ncbi:MAG: aspartate aminotransferase family protein [Gammaproteobacteria bacterium]
MADHLMNTYKPLPIRFTHGKGAYLYDDSGQAYLDALSGIAVCGLGHAHPAITQAICDQAELLLHTSNLYSIEPQSALADSLCSIAQLQRAFFCNSGAEANEAAIKLARLYGHQNAIDTPQIIVTEGSFHGRTMATLSATGNRKIQAGFEPLVPGFLRVPYDDLDAIRTIAANRPDVVAILVEPITGEGGIRVPGDNYLPELRTLCDDNNWLLMLDEIQTGMARTGRWFAHQHYPVKPDVMTLAKGLGNGVPIGACLADGKAADVFQPGSHGSTFGGNPLATRAAIEVINVIKEQQLDKRAAQLGDRMKEAFSSRLSHLDGVVAIRGKGLMIGIELQTPCAALVTQALDKGLLINVTADSVVRLLPPLIISDDEAHRIIDLTCELIINFLSGDPS